VILRLTPGASLVQSPIAALPVRRVLFSAVVPVIRARKKTNAKEIAQEIA
jgi:hypothetical protein